MLTVLIAYACACSKVIEKSKDSDAAHIGEAWVHLLP
jgi:hypothetical protein